MNGGGLSSASENAAFGQVRGHAVQLIIADHARFMQQRIMAEDRAQIAPVTVEIVRAPRSRSPADFKQTLARMKRQFADHQLRFGGRQRPFQHEIFRIGRAAANGIGRAVQGAGVLRHQRVDREAVRREIAYHLLHETVFARRRCRAMQYRAPVLRHVAPRVRENVAHDPCRDRDQMQLPHRAAMAARETGIAARRDFMRKHLHIVEHQAAARRHALPHAVPVVEYLQAFASDRNHDRHLLVVLVLHIDTRIVGERGAGRVVLFPRHAKVLTVAHQPGDDFARPRGTEFRRRTAEDRPVLYPFDLRVVERGARRQQQLLGQIEMNPQRMRNIRLMRGQCGDHMKEIFQRTTEATPLGRKTEHT
ncbi:hypothetical protein KCU90_g747, partial [Aureobasidium melanogenum]